MTTIKLMTHLNSSNEVVNHPDALFFSVCHESSECHFEFSNGLWIVLIHMILQERLEIKIWWVQIGWMRRQLVFAVPADQPIRESMVEPFYRHVGCMWSLPILLDPLHISIHTLTCSMCSPELVQHINITFLCDCDCLHICVFKPKRPDYSMF